MHARVDDQSASPPAVEGQDADAVKIARVKAHLVGQPFRVEAPPLEEGGRPEMTPERRQPGKFLADRDLEMMTRDRFVIGEGLRLVAWPRLGCRCVDVVLTRPRPVLG